MIKFIDAYLISSSSHIQAMDGKQTKLIHRTMLIILIILLTIFMVILVLSAMQRDRVAKCRQSVTLQASQGEDCNWSECTCVSLCIIVLCPVCL